KIIRRNDPIVGRWRVLGFRWRLVGPGEVNERNALRREWEDRHQSGVLDSRQRGETRLKLFVKLNDRRTIGVSHLRQRKPNGQHVCGIESRLFTAQSEKTAEQQSGVREQHERKRDLTCNQPYSQFRLNA